MPGPLSQLEQTVGRYLLFGEIGAGGMATVHIGRLLGPAGFSKLVAIKRLHPHLAKERAFVHSFLDEARIAARVNHPNVVSIHDVVLDGDQVLLVMDYVHGRALSQLLTALRGSAVPPPIAAAITVDLLHGLHAAHTARDERGKPLALVHRDVSPQNVLVGVDGVARVLDFGIAHALGRLNTTTDGAVKGKLAYMAPERLIEQTATPGVDIYAAAIVLWECLAGERYFGGVSEPALLPKVMASEYRHLPRADAGALAVLDPVIARAMAKKPSDRFATSSEFALAIESAVTVASRVEVADWVKRVAGDELSARAEAIEDIERSSLPSLAVAAVTAGATPDEQTAHTNAAVVALAPRAEVTTAPRPLARVLPLAAVAIVVLGAAVAGGLTRSRESVASGAAAPPATGASAARIAEVSDRATDQATDVARPATQLDAGAVLLVTSPANARRPFVLPVQQTIVDAGAAPRAPDAGSRRDLDAPSDRK